MRSWLLSLFHSRDMRSWPGLIPPSNQNTQKVINCIGPNLPSCPRPEVGPWPLDWAGPMPRAKFPRGGHLHRNQRFCFTSIIYYFFTARAAPHGSWPMSLTSHLLIRRVGGSPLRSPSVRELCWEILGVFRCIP